VNILTRCRIRRIRGGQIVLRSLDTGREDRFRGLDALCAARRFQHPLAAYLVRFFAPEGGLEIETHSESPAGAGISGSSALMIAATAALARYSGRKLSPEEIRVIAQNVEAQLIRVPTGCQDYYPALYGGVSAIHLGPDGVQREAVPLDPEALDRRFLLVYTGAPRQSGINNWEVFKAHIAGDRKVLHNFDEIVAIARGMHDAVAASDWPEVERLLRAEWKLRKSNAPGISTPLIERLIAGALREGARAAKVCGAGGGGCLVFLLEEGAKERVVRAVTKLGGRVLPAKVARDGLSLTVGQE